MLNGSTSSYEVLNFGVGGYDVLQEVALLEHRGVAYRPDLVVVGFCLNDVGIASPNLHYLQRIQEYQSNVIFRLRLAWYVASQIDRIRLGKWMNEKNRPEVFERDFKGRIAPISQDERELRELMRSVPEKHPSVWYSSDQRVGRLRYAFEHLADLARREKFSVVIVIFPWLEGDATHYPHRAAHRIVAHEAQRAGFDVIDVLQDFMDAGIRSLRVSERDLIHPNEKGHRIVAEKLSEYVREKRRQPNIEWQSSPNTRLRATRYSRVRAVTLDAGSRFRGG